MRSTTDHAERVVIPKPVREAVRLKPGSPLEIAYRDGKVEIEPVCRPVKLVRKSGLLIAVPPRGTPKISGEQVIQGIRDLRERRLDRC
jgi:AbrB family looped-hinge helix DNA binding protein